MMFNRYMMATARDSRGLTQTELAKALSVKQGTISKYESGINNPPDSFVEDLAGSLNYRREFFYESERPYGMPPFHYRKRKKLGVKPLLKIVAEINIRRMHITTLMRGYEKMLPLRIPEIDRDEYLGEHRKSFSIDAVADHLRDMWMVGSGPIASMIELIESCGGIVIPCDFGTDLIDAMSQRIDGLPVLFFINMHTPSDRMRLTLAHELAHMILHSVDLRDDDVMEREADQFASCLLMPAQEIKPQLRNKFNLRHLSNLKLHWKVSMQALAVRSNQLNLVTPYQFKMFWIEMGKMGYRKREPNEPPKERPRLLLDMIDYHFNELGYTKQELSTLLHLYPTELDLLYSQDNFDPPPEEGIRPRLRVVK